MNLETVVAELVLGKLEILREKIMSLEAVVLEIVAEMEVEAKGWDEEYGGDAQSKLRSFAKQLRRACQAAEKVAAPEIDMTPAFRSLMKSPEEIAARKAARQRLMAEEEESTLLVQMVGGPEDGTSIALDVHFPPGHQMRRFDGSIYNYINGKMVYQE